MPLFRKKTNKPINYDDTIDSIQELAKDIYQVNPHWTAEEAEENIRRDYYDKSPEVLDVLINFYKKLTRRN